MRASPTAKWIQHLPPSGGRGKLLNEEQELLLSTW